MFSNLRLGRAATPPSKFQLSEPVDCVLGGGGIKGLAHVGFLQALAERKIRTGNLYCTSIGSLVGALVANGHPVDTLEDIFNSELERFGKSPFAKAITFESLRKGGLMNLRPFMESIVDHYHLRPQPQLKIVAARRDGLRFRPVIFEGTDYDLVTALTASCAMPPFMQSVVVDIGGTKQSLVDGGLFHPEPFHFCVRPAIISRLGLATRFPKNHLSPLDWAIHMAEMSLRPLRKLFTRSAGPEHLLVNSGDPSVATFTFGLTDGRCEQLVRYGRERTREALDTACCRQLLSK